MRIAVVPSNQVGNDYWTGNTDESAVMRMIGDRCAATLRGYGHQSRTFHIPGGRTELREMCSDVNAWGADLAVSPHSNADAGYDLGILNLAYDSSRFTWAKSLGEDLAERLEVPYRGVWFRPDFIFLRETKMQAIIVEINAHDTLVGAQFNLDNRDRIGDALALATLTSVGATPPPEAEWQGESKLFLGRKDGNPDWGGPITRGQVDTIMRRHLDRDHPGWDKAGE